MIIYTQKIVYCIIMYPQAMLVTLLVINSKTIKLKS